MQAGRVIAVHGLPPEQLRQLTGRNDSRDLLLYQTKRQARTIREAKVSTAVGTGANLAALRAELAEQERLGRAGSRRAAIGGCEDRESAR
jgi:hypothetical protein